jgi:hypothetical protein
MGIEHLAFNVNHQHIWLTLLNLQSNEFFYVTKEVYLVVITQLEVECANLSLNPNLFLHFVYFNYVYFVLHWNELKNGCGLKGLLIALFQICKGDSLLMMSCIA